MYKTSEKRRASNLRHYNKNKEKYNALRRLRWANDSEYRERNKNRGLRLRFQTFLRDKFTCQYCGRKAPDVELHIDHILPKSKGGKNRLDNYITACKECNWGKSDTIINNFQ